jgi:hypothetical protein
VGVSLRITSGSEKRLTVRVFLHIERLQMRARPAAHPVDWVQSG